MRMLSSKEKKIFFKKAWQGEEPSLAPVPPKLICFEYDDVTRKQGIRLTFETIKKLSKYKCLLYDHNGKCPHLYVYNQELKDLDLDLRCEYKRLFLLKYCADKNKIDLSFCKHDQLVAAPGYLHYKVRLDEKPYTQKILVKIYNKNIENKIEDGLLQQAKDELKKPARKFSGAEYTGSIIDIAERRYGLKINSELKANCPFHDNTPDNPSLQFFPDTNSFCCFSGRCSKSIKRTGGDIITFIQLMEGQLRNGR